MRNFWWSEGDHEEGSIRCEQQQCMSCEEWLSFGPSNDEPFNVRVEILAALLANPGGFVHPAHIDHHDQDFIDEWFNYRFRDDCVACHAIALAGAIVEHTTCCGGEG